ncbi:CDP-glucose 4,6-dehydratase [Chitinibacteraceae bacterium HSL-7]
MQPAFWQGRKVFLTGHTGFKGGWLALWLKQLGANVTGYALAPNTQPSLYQLLGIEQRIDSRIADIRHAAMLHGALSDAQPDIVFHLAAQPLVREAYRQPEETWSTNVMGTLNLLEGVRACPSVKAVLVVTTDKCYQNNEWDWPYREADPLGGHDPYSSSKACTEILCASWRDSYLKACGVALATARAGNVIGGGDWSAERLVPDVLRAWQDGQTVELRSPGAVRPWQHVLEPLAGYLLLAQALVERGDEVAEAWNFGPDSAGMATVGEVVAQMGQRWPGATWRVAPSAEVYHEAGLLLLDSTKAKRRIGWRPKWSTAMALERTLDWHHAWVSGQNMYDFSIEQIAAYQDLLNES